MNPAKNLQKKLLKWYEKQKRPLPWRANKDPYRIWISEVMLQQTTVTAVIPYYERFLKAFPKLETLAKAQEKHVLEMWSGLGYYSRARNLHKAAKELLQTGFPKFYVDLIKYPGFGPYTSRAVTSIAFDEAVGVLDGNVIRLLSRLDNQAIEWWKTAGRNQLQDRADQLVQNVSAGEMNQALMELGATICTPKSPACLLCPWQQQCESLKNGTQLQLPLSKPKRESEVWIWRPTVVEKSQKILLAENDYAPFLKGQWLYPGKIEKKKTPPKKFNFKHCITHHEIYVLPEVLDNSQLYKKSRDQKWAAISELKQWNPSALLQKVLKSTQQEEK